MNNGAIVFIPDGTEKRAALARTTHLAISAHQDDIEFMAFAPIAACFGQSDKWFCGVVTTDGAGSPRNGIYADFSDEEMKAVRIEEQKKAATVGRYGAQILLGYSSAQAKDNRNTEIVNDFIEIFKATKPQFVYIHNLADKHVTHVATALKVIAALRALDDAEKPEKVYGCEVWRDLDWMNDNEKVILDCSAHPNLARALSGVFDSQICGGKNYDVAVAGRRAANATFSRSHDCDNLASLNYAMDLTPLVYDKNSDIIQYVEGFINRFAFAVKDALTKLL